MTETNPTAERSAAFDDALQNAGHALMLPDPVPAMARVLAAFRDEYRAELRAAAAVPASAPTDQTTLVTAAAEALTAEAHECDGKCGLSERDCYDAHPISFSAMSNGTMHVTGSVTALAAAVLAVLPAPADRARLLRTAALIEERADDLWAPGTKAHDAMRADAAELRRLADTASGPGRADDKVQQAEAQAPDVGAAIMAALQKRAGELSTLAEEEMRPSLEERAQEWHEAVDVARRAARAATAALVEEARAPFTPPAHYRGRDGTAYCVHAIPVGPDSCRECRDLAEQPAAVSQPGKEA